MDSNLTDIKSPLVLVRSKGVDKLLSGLNICGLGAHGRSRGISADISSRRDCSNVCISGKMFTHFNLLT